MIRGRDGVLQRIRDNIEIVRMSRQAGDDLLRGSAHGHAGTRALPTRQSSQSFVLFARTWVQATCWRDIPLAQASLF